MGLPKQLWPILCVSATDLVTSVIELPKQEAVQAAQDTRNKLRTSRRVAYADARNVSADKLVKLPEMISDEAAVFNLDKIKLGLDNLVRYDPVREVAHADQI
jgi:hypothetical protein